MGGSPICFSRNRSPAPTWSLNYNCQIITSSYKHVLWKLMRCLHKNIFTTCLWTFWEVLSWMLQLGSLCKKLPPAPARCAGPAPCWQRHWPSTKGDHLLPRPETSTGKGKASRQPLFLDRGRLASLFSRNSASATIPWKEDEWSWQVGLTLLELLTNSRCFLHLSSPQGCLHSILRWKPGPKIGNVCSHVSQPRSGNVRKT